MKRTNEFSIISEISTEDSSTWQERIFLTFDIDWAHDEIIEDVLSLCESYSVPITIFATHKTNVLFDSTLKFQKIEIGIHPNFNPLLKLQSNDKDFEMICCDLKNIFPDAKSVRSHSLCFGSLIQTIYEKLNITHDSSLIIPYQKNEFPLFPWKMWDALIRVPYLFCDYVTAMTTDAAIIKIASRTGLKVFDFHPIHVFLNTESLERYERTRPIHQNPKELIKHRYEGYGTRNRLIELLELTKNQ